MGAAGASQGPGEVSIPPGRVPWTINVILAVSILPALVAVFIARFIAADFLGDDGDPLMAVLAGAVGCVPAAAAWALRRGHQGAWLALVLFAAGWAIVYFPTWGVAPPTVLLLLLCHPETRRWVAARPVPTTSGREGS